MTTITTDQPHDTEPLTLRRRFSRFLERHLPEGLYPRSLIIIVTPMVLLQSVVAFAFMERHWETVTKRLSKAVTQDIAMLRMARQRLNLTLSIERNAELPEALPAPFFSLLDTTLSKQIKKRIDRPFWIDTFGRSRYVDIRIKVDDAVFRVIARRTRTYASNSEIFILWMIGTSLLLLWIAIIFLRNQIRPIQQLAEAAQSFGMGRDVPDFRPRGALEVKHAATAFINMRERIERHVEQRTAMLAGVSHDLRTILTRFKLQLAVLGRKTDVADLKDDVDEMQHMLEDYMAFVRGDGGEIAVDTPVHTILEDLRNEALHTGKQIDLVARKTLKVALKPQAFKRCVANLVSNACRFADNVTVKAKRRNHHLIVTVEDDGPGIAAEDCEDVFRPFHRLDHARNQDTGGTGLGLAIALDIAHSHGGDIKLSASKAGGLKAELSIPV
jgi:two-component system osmolarity sensor histidine kinase EnvZ